jgi:hypothetical protein
MNDMPKITVEWRAATAATVAPTAETPFVPVGPTESVAPIREELPDGSDFVRKHAAGTRGVGAVATRAMAAEPGPEPEPTPSNGNATPPEPASAAAEAGVAGTGKEPPPPVPPPTPSAPEPVDPDKPPAKQPSLPLDPVNPSYHGKASPAAEDAAPVRVPDILPPADDASSDTNPPVPNAVSASKPDTDTNINPHVPEAKRQAVEERYVTGPTTEVQAVFEQPSIQPYYPPAEADNPINITGKLEQIPYQVDPADSRTQRREPEVLGTTDRFRVSVSAGFIEGDVYTGLQRVGDKTPLVKVAELSRPRVVPAHLGRGAEEALMTDFVRGAVAIGVNRATYQTLRPDGIDLCGQVFSADAIQLYDTATESLLTVTDAKAQLAQNGADRTQQDDYHPSAVQRPVTVLVDLGTPAMQAKFGAPSAGGSAPKTDT